MDKYNSILLPAGAEVNIIPMMDGESKEIIKESDLPKVIELLPLRNAILFPDTVIPIPVRRKKTTQLLRSAFKNKRLIGVVTQLDPRVDNPLADDLFDTGTIGRVVKIIEMPDGTITAIIQGLMRFHLGKMVETEPWLKAEIELLSEIIPEKSDVSFGVLTDAVKDAAETILELSPNLPQEAGFALKNIEGGSFLINFVASGLELDNPLEKMDLLRESDLKERAMKLLEMLNRQIELLKLKSELHMKVKSEIDQQQREYFLNNQLKTIQEELGMDGAYDDIEEFRKKGAEKAWPVYVEEVFEKELRKLEKINPNAPEYNIEYTYIQTMLDLPWLDMTEDNLDLANAQKVLDHNHYGLESVKDRIIEYLAVLKLKGDMKSPILCLYGPPGVGKTSLGKSIAKALGRRYGRISLGGMHDEAEIRGHRRTYIGAMPGRIIQTIRKAGSANPVIVLDEIDKVAEDFRGDPASALLEALDPEQNTAFHDNYLDIDYDLSNVLFITTANNISTIHPALKDRMEMIEVSGYLAEEKVEIAKKYLLPKQREAHGLVGGEIKLGKKTLEAIIDNYTRESGVRGLDKQIAKICRKVAKKIALCENYDANVKPDGLKSYLGLPTNHHDLQSGNEAPGVVTGLAWTEAGGEILFIECSPSEGKGVLSTTGNLGDVMKESTALAHQYLKAHPGLAGITTEDFMKKDIHIHVPEGAIPKDGPSAGITIVTAMASALRGKSIRRGIAMTGEITLRGKVLPVGGIKEKILAAKRAGVNTIILSKENEKEISEINEIYIKGLTFVYVDRIDEVIDFVFK